MSYEVSTRVVWAVVRMLEHANLPSTGLFDGLPYDASTLRGRRRVSWDDYVVVCENSLAIAGSEERLDELLEDSYSAVLPELRQLARALVEPKLFVRFVFDFANPMAWPALHHELVDISPREMRLTVRTREGARPNPVFFRGNIGALRGIPRRLDLPPAKIGHTDVSPSSGVYDFEVPASRTLARRALDTTRLAAGRLFESIILGEEPADLFETRLDDATVKWDLSRRQIETLRLVVQNRSNVEIAQSFDCSEQTVELHVAQLLRKSKALTRADLVARFWASAKRRDAS